MIFFSFYGRHFSRKNFLVFVFFITLGIPDVESQALGNIWTKKTDMPGSAAPRNRGVAISISGKGYFGTGWDGGSNYYSSWWEYNPVTDSWAQKADFNGGTNPRNRSCGFTLNGKGYVALGADNSQVFTGLFEYNPSSNTWSQKANYGGGARYSAVAFTIGNFAYVGLGNDVNDNSQNDFWRYDPAANSWTAMANFPGSARYSAAAFSIGSYGYVCTGYDGGFTKDMWQYNPLSNSWVKKSDFPGTARSMAISFSIQGRGYVGLGGTALTSFDDLWEYNPINEQWLRCANFGGGSRQAASAFSAGTKGYVVAGSSAYDAGTFFKDIWEYTPASVPVIRFQKTYGGTNDDTDTSRIAFGSPTADGGYIIASSTKSFGAGGFDGYLIKTNSMGDTVWTKTYGGAGDDIISSVQPTTDGGYVLAGFTGGINSDAFIMKTDVAGGVQWVRTFNGPGAERMNYAQETAGGFIATGKGDVAGFNGMSLVKLNTGGSITWHRIYNSNSAITSAEGFSVEETAVGSFITSGHVRITTGAKFDGYFMVATPTGTVLVSGMALNTFSNQNDLLAMVRQAPDGGYIFCGSTGNPPTGDYNIFLLKTSSTGTIQWNRMYGTSNADDVGRALVITPEGDIVVAGFTRSFGAGNEDAFLMKVNSGGLFKWAKAYGGSATDRANSVYQTPDGGFFLVGESSSFSGSGTEVYVVKTDSVGTSGCNEVSATINPVSDTWTVTPTMQSSVAAPSNAINSVFPVATQTKPQKLCSFCGLVIGVAFGDAKCFGACNGFAMVTSSSGTFPFTYSWSNGATTSAVSGLCAGTYTVTVTDADGCSETDSITILEPPSLLVNMVKHSDTICIGQSTTIGANPSGGTPGYTYNWSGGAACPSCTNTSVSPTVTTTYVFSVTDANFCIVKDSVTIVVNSLPVVSASKDTSMCAGSIITLGASGASAYSWTPAAGLSCTNCASPACNAASSTTYNVIGTDSNGCQNSDSVTVTVISNPTVSIATGIPTICSGKGITLSAFTNAGGYSWSTGATTISITDAPTITTVYSVTVTSTNGCTAASTKTITVNPLPVPSFSVTNVSCNGMCNASITATPTAGSSPFTFQWATSPVQSAQTATGLCAGNYFVTIMDANGCTYTDGATVSEPATLTASVSVTNAGCTCSGTATAFPSGGTMPYSYLWNDPNSQTAQSATGLCGGNYSVSITDSSGCTVSDTAFISQPPSITVSVSQDDTICSGESATLTASTGASSGISYTWTPGNLTGSTVTVSPTSNTTYTVVATDISTNCADTAAVSVSVIASPVASIVANPSFTVCTGATVTLTASGGQSYSWSNGNTNASITGVATAAGTYTFSVIAANQQCSDADTVVVTALSSPAVNITATSPTICQGISPDTLIATNIPGGNYFWQSTPATLPLLPANDTVIVSPDVTTTYTVYVSNASGCSAVATYTINVVPGPPDPQINSIPSYCEGDSILPVTGNSTPPNIIVWINSAGNIVGLGDTLPIPQNLGVGTYTIYAIQGTGEYCLSDLVSAVLTIHPPPLADAGNDVTICAGHTAQLNASGGTQYLWSPSDYLNQTNVFNPSSNPDSTITYAVTVTDANNCRNADTVTVFISSSDTCGIKIYQAFTPNNDDNNDVWWIDGINLFPENTVEIYNRWGNQVWSGTKYDNKRVVWRGQNMQGQPLPPGTYFYVIDVTPLGRFSKWVELVR